MRNKIIAVNAVIVLLVGLLAFAIVRTQLVVATTSADRLKKSATRDADAAAALLQLEALRTERWLAGMSTDPSTQAAFAKATVDARAAAARDVADQITQAAPRATGMKPSIVAFVDSGGRILGRNGSSLNRGDDLAAAYPTFKAALGRGLAGSDIWVDRARGDQFVASYVPVRDETRQVGMLVLGVPLNDALAHVRDVTGARGVVLVLATGEPLASSLASGATADVASKGGAEIQKALETGTTVAEARDEGVFAIAPLENLGDGKRTAIVALAPIALLDVAATVPLSLLGTTALAIVLVIVGGWLLGGYISRPIATLEEGLLAVLNGQSDKRFELDHAELGGLAFRIDQLLNQLMGVEEDNTDEHGRVSKAPNASSFGEALSMDTRQLQQQQAAQAATAAREPQALPTGPAPDATALAKEAAEDYYARLYREYIAAKKALGEQVDHITDEAFRSRIQGMERDASSKHGRPVRYHVQSNGKEVVLLAVPLG